MSVDESDMEWKRLFVNLLEEMVPGEEFDLVVRRAADDGATVFELVTESKRVMVAWSEMQDAINELAKAQ